MFLRSPQFPSHKLAAIPFSAIETRTEAVVRSALTADSLLHPYLKVFAVTVQPFSFDGVFRYAFSRSPSFQRHEERKEIRRETRESKERLLLRPMIRQDPERSKSKSAVLRSDRKPATHESFEASFNESLATSDDIGNRAACLFQAVRDNRIFTRP